MAAVTGPQRFLESILPSGLFESLEAGTRTYMLECPCGRTRDLWEAGGLKRAGSEQYTWAHCPACEQRTWQHKREKTPEETRQSMLEARRAVVFLSSHAWWASMITWGVAALFWSAPVWLISLGMGPVESTLVWVLAYFIGWLPPYLWMTTRYRLGRTRLVLSAGWASRELELHKIECVSRSRKGIGLSFAFDTNPLWIGYPSRFGGYLVSPKEKELFLELLGERCPRLRKDPDAVQASHLKTEQGIPI